MDSNNAYSSNFSYDNNHPLLTDTLCNLKKDLLLLHLKVLMGTIDTQSLFTINLSNYFLFTYVKCNNLRFLFCGFFKLEFLHIEDYI